MVHCQKQKRMVKILVEAERSLACCFEAASLALEWVQAQAQVQVQAQDLVLVANKQNNHCSLPDVQVLTLAEALLAGYITSNK